MVDGSLAHAPTLDGGPPAAVGQRLPAGARAGEYVVERFVGAGAMGEVYAGRHPVIGKQVAIKVLRRELASSADAAERFTREARAAGAIDHPNVVDVFAFGRLDDGRLYLVMDFVDGRSLRAHLGDGALELGAALDIVAAIADALDAAHARGVIHRDLKPDNIVLTDTTPPKVYVLDFGIAKLVSAAGDGATGPGTLTGQGTWLGTPGYMAPEQWSADGARAASDRYALGVIAYELLVGALPFSATSVPQMMEQHFRAEVPAASARGRAVPPAIDPVLRRALAKDPDARFASARELVVALRAAAGTSAGARAAVVAPRSPTRVPWLPATAGVVVLGGMIAGGLALRGGGTPDRDRELAASPRGAAEPVERVRIASLPDGAEVTTGERVLGTTPIELDVRAGDAMTIVVAKAGYAAQTVTVRAGVPVPPVQLVAVTGFEGVWRLPGGELRAFERRDDRVDVFKLDEVAGPRRFYRHFALVAAQAGVAFADRDEIVDARSPGDPTCHVPVRVEYRYEPAHDVLELHRDKVSIDVVDGRCAVRSRDTTSELLVRVDRAAEAREVLAPAGELELAKKLKVVNQQKRLGTVKKKTPPPPKPTVQAADLGTGGDNANAANVGRKQAPVQPPARPPQPILPNAQQPDPPQGESQMPASQQPRLPAPTQPQQQAPTQQPPAQPAQQQQRATRKSSAGN